MPISAQCSCGKRVSVSDALAGKTIRCPACGDPIEVVQAAPAAGPSAARRKPAASPVVYVSLGKIIAIVSFATVAVCGILFFIGPVQVYKQWENIGPTANTGTSSSFTSPSTTPAVSPE